MTIYATKSKRGELVGTWTVEVVLNGKRSRGVVKDFDEAKRMEAAWEAGLEFSTKAAAVEQQYTVGDLERDSMRRLRGTKDERQSCQRLEVICSILGRDQPLKSVRLAQLEKVVDNFRAKNRMPATINRHLAAISGAMKWAKDHDLLENPPAIPWQEGEQNRDAFIDEKHDDEIVAWFLKKGVPDMALIYEVLLVTGMRMGELLTLRTDQVAEHWIHLEDTKNGDPRDVPFPTHLVEPLKALITHGFIAHDNITKWCHKVAADLGIDDFTPHTIRHTCATRLNDRGVSTATIKEYLGHRSVTTTLKYTHNTRRVLQDASRSLRGAPRNEPTAPREMPQRLYGTVERAAGQLQGNRPVVPAGSKSKNSMNSKENWRPRPESNRDRRICSPLRNHSATRPRPHALTSVRHTRLYQIALGRSKAPPAFYRPRDEDRALQDRPTLCYAAAAVPDSSVGRAFDC